LNVLVSPRTRNTSLEQTAIPMKSHDDPNTAQVINKKYNYFQNVVVKDCYLNKDQKRRNFLHQANNISEYEKEYRKQQSLIIRNKL
jgi:hypothetical protein